MSLLGRQIGRYKVLEQVGQGGMSVVYRGLDTALEREVAVKVLHPHLAGKPESRRRLEREAKAVARLKHPNILEVYDFAGVDAEDAYLVTEFIRGKTLRQFIADEALSPPEIAAMVLHELASALAVAHDSGVIHRDLKPENVMVRDDGVLKLMDFGIAKILDKDDKMTMTGALVGSPAHMAPEIIEGEESGPEADVFSLGTMLYLFATGKLPFTAPNTTATLKRILDCVYDDPRQLVPTVSDELAEIIATCLRRKPSERYPSAGKLRDALADYLSSLGLSRPHEELAKFFLDPRGYRKAFQARITEALLAQAERLVAEKKNARAMSALNQVLAHDAQNERAAQLLDQMKKRKVQERRAKRLVRAALAGGALIIVGASGLRGFQLANRAPEWRLPAVAGPTDVVLTSVHWPGAAPAEPPPPLAPVEPPDAGASTVPAAVVKAAEQNPKKAQVIDRLALKPPPVTIATHPPLSEVEVRVMVRPWGFLSVDRGPKSAEALAVHVLKLSPGPHAFTVTCDACESAGSTRTVDVQAGQDAPIMLVAPLRPSLVSFDGYPAEAIARVGADQRTVAESRGNPFRIVSPPEGLKEMRHLVRFEVMLDGKTIDKGERFVQPGQPAVIARKGP